MRCRFFCFYSFLILLFSCAETRVDNNIRILVKGSVFDQFNNPIEGAMIKVITLNTSNGALPVLLGSGFSDVNGTFDITILFGSNDRFTIEITNSATHSVYIYTTNTRDFIPNDLEFNLGEVLLNQVSAFNYSIMRVSGLGNTLSYDLEYILPQCFEVYENELLNENQTRCYDPQSTGGTLGDNNPDLNSQFLLVPLDSEVIFTYKINDGEEVTETLIINETTNDFEFTY